MRIFGISNKTNMKTIKNFADIKIGDIAEYNEYEFPIIGIGTVGEMFDDFGDRAGQISLSEFLDPVNGITLDSNAIAVQDEKNWDGDVSIFVYDQMAGAVVFTVK